MNATNQQGHEWNGEIEREGKSVFYLYTDDAGRLYSSKEVPAYRIKLNATQQTVNGKRTICALPTDDYSMHLVRSGY